MLRAEEEEEKMFDHDCNELFHRQQGGRIITREDSGLRSLSNILTEKDLAPRLENKSSSFQTKGIMSCFKCIVYLREANSSIWSPRVENKQ